jgi:hypothetical protein
MTSLALALLLAAVPTVTVSGTFAFTANLR